MHTILQVLGYVTEKKKNARDILKWRFPPGVGETAFGVFLSKARTWLNALHDRYEVVAGITRGVDDGPLEPGRRWWVPTLMGISSTSTTLPPLCNRRRATRSTSFWRAGIVQW